MYTDYLDWLDESGRSNEMLEKISGVRAKKLDFLFKKIKKTKLKGTLSGLKEEMAFRKDPAGALAKYHPDLIEKIKSLNLKK